MFRTDNAHEAVTTALHEVLLGNDPRVAEVRALVDQIAPSSLAVLITGETGTGKDIVARQLHKRSPRYGKPFIKVNCPSIPEGMFESELFGFERGAFTGAYAARPGRFEQAHQGTLFLDEVSEAPKNFQTKLVHVLEGEPFMRIGGTTSRKVDVRIVAATNLPINKAVAMGRFREDVAFRLGEVVIHLPPLRERRGDIPLLAEHFNYNMCLLLKKPYVPLSAACLARLEEQQWPGNVRELASRVREYVTTGDPDVLYDAVEPPAERPREAAVPSAPSSPRTSWKGVSLKETARLAAESAERALIEEALRYTLWNRREAAKLLKTSYSSLLRRIEHYRIGKSQND